MKLRTKVNWNDAFISYCTPTLDGQNKSYADIAYEYDVSLRAVERFGSKDTWVERRCEVGISKKSKYLAKRYDISVVVYNELLKTWLLMLEHARKTIEDALEGQEKLNPHDFATLSRALATITDQTRKFFPEPKVPTPKESVNITDDDVAQFNRFLGI